ncbi:cytochrome c3 family protein [Geothrix sp. SG200]|uniref:cytochrome c3 family protein n=1 Tax=Geothrix sp. SG200 TaxID=2922865 RepID=UPI001FAD7D53|nr:cytochrome c3 family protein [Geothrix sp. SG200]
MGLLAAQGRPAPAAGQAPSRSGASTSHGLCASCHMSHRKGALPGKSKLVRAATEPLCLSCHEGSATLPGLEAAPKLSPWSGQGSGHVKGRFSSRRAESYLRTARDGQSRTVRLAQDCLGCHEAHGKERGKLRTTAFDARGQLLDRRPQAVAEICFGCHAGQDAAQLPSGTRDLGSQFDKGAVSSHRIGATMADRPDLPSLRSSVFQGRLDCTSCHDNPDASGSRGPHVSANPAILKAPFGHEKDLGRLGDRVNDLCFLCHDKPSILTNQSFPYHSQHLNGFTGGGPAAPRRVPGLSEAAAVLGIRSSRDLRPGRSGALQPGYGEPTACATCHASHGSPRQASLIEFDRSVVTASSVGGANFQRLGMGHGTCTLTCHGYDHVQARY